MYKIYPATIDINECEVGSHRCGNHSTCSNLVGSYHCICQTGYTSNSVGCTGKE